MFILSAEWANAVELCRLIGWFWRHAVGQWSRCSLRKRADLKLSCQISVRKLLKSFWNIFIQTNALWIDLRVSINLPYAPVCLTFSVLEVLHASNIWILPVLAEKCREYISRHLRKVWPPLTMWLSGSRGRMLEQQLWNGWSPLVIWWKMIRYWYDPVMSE